MKISFDVVGDFNLSSSDDFNWHGKASSLYCIVTGNISEDIIVVKNVLLNLSMNYHCVFFIPGKLEFLDALTINERVSDLAAICSLTKNVVLMRNHVCVVDGIAVVGITANYGYLDDLTLDQANFDYLYLLSSIERLQKHQDINKIICVTSTTPCSDLWLGEIPKDWFETIDFTSAKASDTEKKIVCWIYGSGQDSSEQELDGIMYITNPANTKPYYPARILV